MAKDAWTTDSGLPDDCDARVTDARFEASAEFSRVQLVLELETQDDGQTFFGYYGIGSTDLWAVVGRGTAVENDKGKSRYHKNSAAGELVTAIAQHAPETYLDSAEPTDAATYIGLVAHWARVDRAFTIDGKSYTAERLLPTAIHKVPEVQTQSKNGSGDYRAEVEALVTSCDTEDEFMQRALAVDGVLGDEEAEEFVAAAWANA